MDDTQRNKTDISLPLHTYSLVRDSENSGAFSQQLKSSMKETFCGARKRTLRVVVPKVLVCEYLI